MSLPHRPPDEGISSILGFIAGLVVVTGSMAMVIYFVASAPDTAPREEAIDLEGASLRAADALTTTAGQPADWHTETNKDVLSNPATSELSRVGLLAAPGSKVAEWEKIERIRDGTLNRTALRWSLGLDEQDLAINLTGRIVSVPLLEPPTSTTYAVVNANIDADEGSGLIEGDESISWTPKAASESAADLFAAINTKYEPEMHQWAFDWDTHPSEGLGNTHPDHAWWIETQLFPQMAGVAATYTVFNAENETGIGAEPRVDTDADDAEHYAAYDEYVSGTGGGGNEEARVARWHIVEAGAPDNVPGGKDDGDHVLTMATRKSQASGKSQGFGTWRSVDGHRAWAAFGPVDVTGAGAIELKFDHVLKVDDEEASGENRYCYGDTFDESCTAVFPSILFWNATSSEWTRILPNPSCGASNWADHSANEEVGANWTAKTVNLCEAVEHAEGQLYFAFYWDSWCNAPAQPNPWTECDTEPHVRSWFLDNVRIKAEGEIAFSTGFDPLDARDDRELLFTSHDVYHNRTYEAFGGSEYTHLARYATSFVKAGGNVFAFAPHESGIGDWLGEVGLAANATVSTDVRTVLSHGLAMTTPNKLPATASDYTATPMAWALDETKWWRSGNSPEKQLTRVQITDDDIAGVFIHGQPYQGGGQVAALAYDLDNFANAQLRDDLIENAYTSAMFRDPTFQTGSDATRANAESKEVQATKRVILVPVTSDGVYTLPMEITTYLWPLASS